MRSRRLTMFRWAVVLLVLLAATAACRQATNADTSPTFAGSTIRVLVGFPAGGSVDLQARLTTRHLGRFLPGHPTVIVENMPGAGGAVASNYLASAAAADGLTVGLFSALSAPELVDSRVFERLSLLGSPGPVEPLIAFTKRSGIASVDDWRRSATAPTLGNSGPQAFSFVVPRIAAATLNLPLKIVSGYAGTSDIRLAMESGEVDGFCFDGAVTRSDQLAEANAVLLFGSRSGHSPGAIDALSIAPDAHARLLLETGVYDMRAFGRVYAAPLGVPAARLALLRDGLARTWADAQLLAEAKLTGLAIAPIGAEELERTVARIAGRKDAVAELRDILRVR